MTTVCVKDIKVLGGRRAVDLEKVKALAESIETTGLINPITVTTDYTLISGAHRLAAYALLEWEEIPVIVLDLKGLQKELAEIDENLVRSELTELQRAMYLARRKEIYEEIHPTTKHGGSRTSYKKSQVVTNTTCFTKEASSQTGKSESSVEKSVKIGKSLSKPAKAKLEGTSIADNKSELLALAKVPKQQQAKVVEKVLTGQAESVREVVKPVVKPVIVAVPKSQAQIRKERAEMLDSAVTAMLDLMPSVKSRNTIKETLELYEQFDSQADVISEALDYFEKGWKP